MSFSFSVIGAACSFVACEQKETGAPQHRHTLAHDAGRASTCYSKGTKDYYRCLFCDKIFADEDGTREVALQDLALEYLPHTVVSDKAENATCLGNGRTEGKRCSVCGALFLAAEAIPATGHTEAIDVAKEPTCTQEGMTEGKHCAVCDMILLAQQSLPASHKYAENEGVYKCVVCGEIRPS